MEEMKRRKQQQQTGFLEAKAARVKSVEAEGSVCFGGAFLILLRVSLCSPKCPRTGSVNQAVLKLTAPPASASWD